MRPDRERDGLTPVDIYPPLTQREALDFLWATDPRRDWPSRTDLENEREPPAQEAGCDE